MRILYGVAGEGMGHATRSAVVIDHLIAAGHGVLVASSGRAAAWFAARYREQDAVEVRHIAGLRLACREGRVSARASIQANLRSADRKLHHNHLTAREVLGTFDPELVISDFETWSWAVARRARVPVIAIDNNHGMIRLDHDPQVDRQWGLSRRLARAATRARVPKAWHYLVSSFAPVPVARPRTTVVPPILRPAVTDAVRAPGDHVLVYQSPSAVGALVPRLRRLPGRFVVYGTGRDAVEGNIHFRPFHDSGFVEDLRTARAVIATAGFSLMTEALHLRVPMLAVPLTNQYEQLLNARYLAALGYGAWCPNLDARTMGAFLKQLPAFQDALDQRDTRDHAGMLLRCLDELIERARLGEAPPVALNTPALGDWWSAQTDRTLRRAA